MTYEDYQKAIELRESAKSKGFSIGYSAVQRSIELWRGSRVFCYASVEEAIAFLDGWDAGAGER